MFIKQISFGLWIRHGRDEYKSTCVQNFKQNYSVKVDEFEILSGVTIYCKICDFLLNFVNCNVLNLLKYTFLSSEY